MSVVWKSQVTHTAIEVIGEECRSATYTTNAGTPLIYALGAVFDAPGGQLLNPYEPKRKMELGQFADESVARKVCEAFCAGKSESEIAEIARAAAEAAALGPRPVGAS